MEQYLLQVPKKLAQEVRRHVASGDVGKVELISGGALPAALSIRTCRFVRSCIGVHPRALNAADNKHFKLVVDGKEYASKIGASGAAGLRTYRRAIITVVTGDSRSPTSTTSLHPGDPQDVR